MKVLTPKRFSTADDMEQAGDKDLRVTFLKLRVIPRQN